MLQFSSVQVLKHENTVYPPPLNVPPAQWGDVYGRAGDDGCELLGVMPADDEFEALPSPQQAVQHPDELGDADFPPAPPQPEPLVAARCVSGTLLRPGNAEEEHLPQHADRVKYLRQEVLHWAEELQGSDSLQEAGEAVI